MNAIAEVIPVSTPRLRVLFMLAIATAVVLLFTQRRGGVSSKAARETPTTPGLAAKPATVVGDTVQPHSTDVWPFRLTGLMHARVSVQSHATADLQCRLLDPEGKEIQSRQAFRDPCRFGWTPTRTGAYRLEVRNTRSRAVPYTVIVK